MATAADLVKDALLLVQATSANRAVDGTTQTNSIRLLNRLLSHWTTKGCIPWSIADVVLPLNVDQASYLLGSASTDAEWALESDFYSTTLSAAASTSATSVSVTSASDIAVGDRIGIELSAGTRQWTTVGSKSGTTITLGVSTGLTGAAASGASVYTYTSRPARPLRFINVRRRQSDTDTPMRIESMDTYQRRNLKTQSGTPTEVYYRPTLTSGTLYVWQPASDVETQIRATVETARTAIADGDDDIGVPADVELALTYRLADMLEPQFGQIDVRRAQAIKFEAGRLEQEAFAFALDQGDVHFVLRRR